MNINIRSYKESDYEQLMALYRNSEFYGGQFDENRDAKDKLKKRIEGDSDAILVYEKDNKIIGTVSLIEDGRVAWLFRFCVEESDEQETIAQALFDKATELLVKKGHHQVLVYAPVKNEKFSSRYNKLGFAKGEDYTCFWKNI